MKYRLALDLGSTSLGWAMIQLDGSGKACAVIRAGVRIFPDGRNPKDGSSLAVTRRLARAMRRRRDRLLKRKARMQRLLIEHGFFPVDVAARKALERLNPYALRAKGLDEALTPAEFGRALFHINQRRGFKSNRRTDKRESDSGALKAAIAGLRAQLDPSGAHGKARTVGELLWRRISNENVPPERRTVRARYREARVIRDDGKTRVDKSYDLYIDRAMIEAEFDALWAKQSALDPVAFSEVARAALKDCLLHQRKLRPVVPGRCTLLPDEPRAPLALPSQQRFRILQEVNHLRLLGGRLLEEPLSLAQRDKLATALESGSKSFNAAIPKLLGLSGSVKFNLEDVKRSELQGNKTSMLLGKKDFFGPAWHGFDAELQDEIVMQLLNEESEPTLIAWLQQQTGVDEVGAERIANVSLPDGYGSLSRAALARILPALRADVITYDKAVLAAGFPHHSHISHAASGEILPELPYYGEYLTRHVGFGSGVQSDPAEKRYGRIANPTVHIGLNQVRTIVNALVKRYGHPTEVIVEVARELKQSREQRQETQAQQAKNQKRNEQLRQDVADVLQISPDRVRRSDIEKLILWNELSSDAADRRCPYSGVQLSVSMVLSDEVEIEHILPFSQTLDDSLNNRTIAMRKANRVKGNRSPWDARELFAAQGWAYDDILLRAERMPRAKRYRFAANGYQQWLRDDKDFLARALNDTRYLSRVAREYLSLICPGGTRVIPGQMTAQLRAKFGLNHVLGPDGAKNRNDHRHHAVDACVIGVTDQALLQRFAQASADARGKGLEQLVERMPDPWPTYRDHVQRAIHSVLVSYKPDHGHEGAMHNDTAYALVGGGQVSVRKTESDGRRHREVSALTVIEMADMRAADRHGLLDDGRPRPYKGYKGDSNYCIEIVEGENSKWAWRVISTFDAYQIERTQGLERLRHPRLGQEGQRLVMRLMIGDYVRADFQGHQRLLVVKKIRTNGTIYFAQANEANVRQRADDRDPTLTYGTLTAGSLRKARGRAVTVSPIGELRDPGFKG